MKFCNICITTLLAITAIQFVNAVPCDESVEVDSFGRQTSEEVEIKSPVLYPDPTYNVKDIVHAILKAPFHTCSMKKYPALKAFIQDVAPKYPDLKPMPYSQKPSVHFFADDGDILEIIELEESTDSADMEALLAAREMRRDS